MRFVKLLMFLLQNLKRNQEERGEHGNDGALEEASIKNLAEKFVHQVRLNHLT